MVAQVSINIEQASYTVGLQVAKFVGDVKRALAAGNAVQDAVAIAAAFAADLLPVLGELSAVKAELSENREALVNTGVLVGEKVLEAILS